ncbi:AraC family transcriptional regulator [Blautia sp. MSJ-19]|uniref:AraC family transcriptional regulator n=1 Tax=Blautia sp. MSJ-19 TaxID=2841517 RepID=UPI00209F75FB|nr:AraC family transcriptional regulator [Blautia sp. MSJ-19]
MEKQNGMEYQETKQHGSRLFPFNIYPCTIPLDFPAVSLHWHKEMELIYIKKGKGLVQLEAETFQGSAGDIFVVTPGTLHSIHRLKGYSMEYENIIFEMDFLGEGAADLCAGEFLVPLASGRLLPPVQICEGEEQYDALKQCLVQMEELCRTKEKGYELGVKAAVLQMIFLLIRKYPSIKTVSSPDRERLKEVLQEICARSSENMTVADMAGFCGWSSSHFMRWFKKMTGDSFTSYVNDRRLAEAAEALRQSDDKIISISQDAGFTNLSNFNRQFKSRYGVTPREYREMIGI